MDPLSIFVFFLILSVLVLVHEFGHFLMAKKFGIKVLEFGFGIWVSGFRHVLATAYHPLAPQMGRPGSRSDGIRPRGGWSTGTSGLDGRR